MIRKKLELGKLRPKENNANARLNREDMNLSRRRRLSRLLKERKRLRSEELSKPELEKRRLSKIESQRNREMLSKPRKLKLPKTQQLQEQVLVAIHSHPLAPLLELSNQSI